MKLGPLLILGIFSQLTGCVLLQVQAPPPAYWPERAAPPEAGGHLGWLLLLAAGLGLSVWVGLRMFHGLQAGQGGPPLDREDAALMRTARDALALLLRKHLRRLALFIPGRPHR